MKIPANGAGAQAATASSDAAEGEKKRINPELWQACAGPVVNMPVAGTHVVYFPQGHSEQVAASMKKDVDAQIPNYPNLPSKLLCLLHNVSLLADPETDEVYAQMTLLPVPSFDKDALLGSDLSMKTNKPQTEFFCKTLTASDTSTHGGFSVPRRAAEKTFPPLDFTMQPPAQELVARDLHDNVWTFRHIYRGQPKRHLLTTGWSLFVSGKRLFAGDAVLFIRDEKQQLLLGIRRANRQPANLSSSVLSSDSMHIGILAAAAHAAANNSPFTVFYNPRASPSEFVIPLAKYYKAVCSNQISLGMRFRMMFETEESGTRRYMGTINGISDLDPVRWKNSQWRNLQVGWDESTAGEKRNRVSIWDIEPLTAPFFICPTTPFFRSKRQRQPGMPDDDLCDPDSLFRRMPWLGDDFGMKDPHSLPGFSLVQWMNMQQQNPSLATSMQPNCLNPLSSSILQTFPTTDVSRQYNNLQFNNTPRSTQPVQQLDQLQKPLASVIQTQQPFNDTTQPTRQSLTNQMLQTSQVQSQFLQSQNPVQSPNVLNNQLQRSLAQNLPQQPQQPQDLISFQSLDHVNQQLHVPENQIQLQLLQKLHQQQEALLAQQSGIQRDQHKSTMLSQSHVVPQQMTRNNSQTNLQFAQPKLHQQVNPMNNQLSGGDSSLLMGAAGGGQSGITDEIPSCSTSPSTNNCSNAVQFSSTGIKNVSSNGNVAKELQQKLEVKPSVNISKNQNQGLFPTQTYLNPGGSHIDYLDSSCSATSVLSQNDVQTQQNFNSQSMLFRAAGQDRELQGDRRNNNVPFGDNCGNQLGMPMMNEPLITKSMMGSGDFSNNLSSGGEMLSNYENPKETQPELSSSMVTQSFGVPDMAFNSIDSTINDSSFMNGGAWAPPPQIPIKRTFTKVYKRGAVGRSIDIARYSGYEELKHDLARRFGIEGQLEDRQRVGWKLVYVDHENDVLLVGDDPWEEFVNCVRYIKILSPQEVQQMSLDGDFGNSILPNQDCSSSDNGQVELTFRKSLS